MVLQIARAASAVARLRNARTMPRVSPLCPAALRLREALGYLPPTALMLNPVLVPRCYAGRAGRRRRPAHKHGSGAGCSCLAALRLRGLYDFHSATV